MGISVQKQDSSEFGLFVCLCQSTRLKDYNEMPGRASFTVFKGMSDCFEMF